MLDCPRRDLERRSRHNHRRSVWPAGYLLAIAAMAFEHQQWRGAALVSHIATNAAPGKRKIHAGLNSARHVQTTFNSFAPRRERPKAPGPMSPAGIEPTFKV